MAVALPLTNLRRSMSRSFVRAIHAAAFTCLAGAVLVTLAFQEAWPSLVLWPAILALVPMTALLYALHRWRTTFLSSAYLIIGGLAVYWYGFTVASQIDLGSVSASASVALPKIALVLVGGSGFGAGAGLRWCTAGFVVAEVASSVAIVQSGSPLIFDGTTAASYGVTALVLVLTYIGQRRTRPSQSMLDRAARDELVSTLRYRIELKAAAMLHDTVLSHLSAIAAATSDEVRPALAQQVRRDLAVLEGDEWLRDAAPLTSADGETDWHESPLYLAVREARAMGLEVDATGDSTALMRLDSDRATALGLAVKQCLVNVIKHSGTLDAEVAVYGSDDELLVMVVDTGRGFDEDETAHDRLGLRNSVHGRIDAVGGSVQVWSTPGRGCSIVIRVPVIRTRSTAHEGERAPS